jgi:hypothetical protein
VAVGLLDQVMGWSYLFQEIRFTVGTRLLGALSAPAAPAATGAPWRYDARYEAAFRRDLRNLIVLAKVNGVRPVVATQSIAFSAKTDFGKLTEDEKRMQFDKPAIFYATIPPAERHGVFQRYNQAIREVAAAEGAILADVDREIPKTPEFHWDYCHLTDKGSAMQAAVIHRAIVTATGGAAGG